MENVVTKRKLLTPTISNELRLIDIHLFNQLTEAEFLQLELNATRKSFEKRSMMYCEGGRHSGIYVVLKGIVKIFKIGSNGKQQIIRFAQKGDVIAYRSLLSNELACTSAVAFEETVVSHIPYNVLLETLQYNWNFTHKIMMMMCKELRESNTFVADIALKTVRERTAEILLILKDEFGVDNSNRLQLSITREDLANMVGTATESLIRIMSEFRNEGLLDFPGRSIVFLNVSVLRVVANL